LHMMKLADLYDTSGGNQDDYTRKESARSATAADDGAVAGTQGIIATSIAPKQLDHAQLDGNERQGRRSSASTSDPPSQSEPSLHASGEFPSLGAPRAAMQSEYQSETHRSSGAGASAHASSSGTPHSDSDPAAGSSVLNSFGIAGIRPTASGGGASAGASARPPLGPTGRAPSPVVPQQSPPASASAPSLTETIQLRRELALMRQRARIAREQAAKSSQDLKQAQTDVYQLQLSVAAADADLQAAVQHAREEAKSAVEKAKIA